MRKKIDYNQYILARRVTEIIDQMDPASWTSSRVEIVPNEDCTQLNVFMCPSDMGSSEFYALLIISNEIDKGKYLNYLKSEIGRKRFTYLREEFNLSQDPDEIWSKAINKYGKKFYLKFDDTLKDSDYVFSVYGEVPNGFDPYENGFMKI